MRGRHIPRDRDPALPVHSCAARATRPLSASARGRAARRVRPGVLHVAGGRAGARGRARFGPHYLRALLALISHSVHSDARPTSSLQLRRHILLMLITYLLESPSNAMCSNIFIQLVRS